MSSRLDDIIAAPRRQLSIEEYLSEIAEEENGGNGFEPGDVVTHVEYRDFTGEVVSRDDGYVRVRVLHGWRGVKVPEHPVRIKASRLEGV